MSHFFSEAIPASKWTINPKAILAGPSGFKPAAVGTATSKSIRAAKFDTASNSFVRPGTLNASEASSRVSGFSSHTVLKDNSLFVNYLQLVRTLQSGMLLISCGRI
ncbi:hypothetical protein ACOME3_010521 [Neoechinorhynchus agilis]